jgi:hypothetical protein
VKLQSIFKADYNYFDNWMKRDKNVFSEKYFICSDCNCLLTA